MIVIGKEAFDLDYLMETVLLIRSIPGYKCTFLGQEEFWTFIQFGRGARYVQGDQRIKDHPGLSFLAQLGFRWPSTEAFPGFGTTANILGWSEESTLKKIYGYHVEQGTSPYARQEALRRAIRPDALGLQPVAEHIAWQIRLNKRRHDNLHAQAVERWDEDLEWLRITYYEKSLYSFIWPDTR